MQNNANSFENGIFRELTNTVETREEFYFHECNESTVRQQGRGAIGSFVWRDFKNSSGSLASFIFTRRREQETERKMVMLLIEQLTLRTRFVFNIVENVHFYLFQLKLGKFMRNDKIQCFFFLFYFTLL